MTSVILNINHSSTDSPFGTSGIDWVAVNATYDTFIFSNGGAGVADGNDTPTDEELNRAAVQLSASVEVDISKYFLLDYSADELKELFLAGNQDKQYVFCAEFDGATATEPQLEAWDNDSMNSYANAGLGNGTPSASWYKAVATKTSSPGADWTGVALAGNGASNIVLLNEGNGALSGAENLYFNFKIAIPAGYVTPALHTPVLIITYTTN